MPTKQVGRPRTAKPRRNLAEAIQDGHTWNVGDKVQTTSLEEVTIMFGFSDDACIIEDQAGKQKKKQFRHLFILPSQSTND